MTGVSPFPILFIPAFLAFLAPSLAALGSFGTLGSVFSVFDFASLTFGASFRHRMKRKTRLVTSFNPFRWNLTSYPEFPRRACADGGVCRPHQRAGLQSLFKGSPYQVLQPHQIHRGVLLFDIILYGLGGHSFARVQLFQRFLHHNRGGGMCCKFAQRPSI